MFHTPVFPLFRLKKAQRSPWEVFWKGGKKRKKKKKKKEEKERREKKNQCVQEPRVLFSW